MIRMENKTEGKKITQAADCLIHLIDSVPLLIMGITSSLCLAGNRDEIIMKSSIQAYNLIIFLCITFFTVSFCYLTVVLIRGTIMFQKTDVTRTQIMLLLAYCLWIVSREGIVSEYGSNVYQIVRIICIVFLVSYFPIHTAFDAKRQEKGGGDGGNV